MMVDIPRLSVGTDYQTRHADSISIDVNLWWIQMVVKTAPIIPGYKNSCTPPVGAGHDRINKARDVGLTCVHGTRGVFTVGHTGNNPRNLGQRSIPGIDIKLIEGYDVSQLVILLNILKQRQGIPIIHRDPTLLTRCAFHFFGVAIGLRARREVVLPRNPICVQQVRDLQPQVPA